MTGYKSSDISVDATDKFCVHYNGNLWDALCVIDRAAIRLAVVCDDDGRVIGVISDGDVRRALLAHKSLYAPLAAHIRRDFVGVSVNHGRSEVLDLMQARRIPQIPIIDEHHRLVGMHTLEGILGRDERPNWAVIMAGGKGTRLRPVTENIPKPMVPVAGRPILERIVLHLVSYGIRKVFLSVNYLSHVIEQHFRDGSQFGCKIEYLREEEPLGTGGALSLLAQCPEDPVLVINGDLVTQSNFDRMFQFHDKGSYYATMGVRSYSHEVPFGCAETDGDRLVQLKEKPVLTKLVNAGVYILSPDAMTDVPARTFFPITQLFESALANGHPCGVYTLEEDWMDIGQPHQLRKANGIL